MIAQLAAVAFVRSAIKLFGAQPEVPSTDGFCVIPTSPLLLTANNLFGVAPSKRVIYNGLVGKLVPEYTVPFVVVITGEYVPNGTLPFGKLNVR